MGQSVRIGYKPGTGRTVVTHIYLKHNSLAEVRSVIYRTLVRPLVIYGAARWSLTATDENAPRSFEGRILRKIFGPV
jgi:hypothetical protein